MCVVRKIPEDIKKYIEVYKPYRSYIKDGKMEDAPENVVEAFEKVGEWLESLPQ